MKLGSKSFRLIVFLALVIVFSVISVCAAEEIDTVIKLQINNPVMTVNGIETEIDPGRGTVPVVVEGRTLVPIRAIIEALGGTVGWDGEKSEVTLNVGEDEIRLVIDSKSAFLNNEESILDVAPTTINDRTMLPIRYVAESFKFEVEWDDATSTVTIIKKGEIDSVGTTVEVFEDLDPTNAEPVEEETVNNSPYDGERLVDDGFDYSQDNEEEEEYYEDEYYYDEYYSEG